MFFVVILVFYTTVVIVYQISIILRKVLLILHILCSPLRPILTIVILLYLVFSVVMVNCVLLVNVPAPILFIILMGS